MTRTTACHGPMPGLDYTCPVRSFAQVVAAMGVAGFLLAAAPPHQSGVNAAARFGPRPAVCEHAEDFWLRARDPALARSCAALARSYSLLQSKPAAAIQAADAAAALPAVARDIGLLRARAAVRTGQFAHALGEFRRSGVQSGAELADAATLHEFALAAVGSADYALALGAYRALVPRSALLSADPGRGLRVSVEAAMAAMRLGKDHLDEALGYLTPAIREADNVRGDIETYLRATQELTWYRQGRSYTPDADASERAFRLSGELPGWVTIVASTEGRGSAQGRPESGSLTRLGPESWRPFLLAHEYWALVAIEAQHAHAEFATEAWRNYLSLAPTDDPWRASVRAQLESLGGSQAL